MRALALAPLFFLELVRGSPLLLPRLYVERMRGHSGSRWLASLLASVNVTTYFQFSGVRVAADRANVRFTDEERWKSLEALYNQGCSGGRGEHICTSAGSRRCAAAHFVATKWRDDFCASFTGCNDIKQYAGDCVGVATIDARPPVRTAAAIAKRLPGVRIIAWERGNSAKAAFSALRCASLVAVDPATFLAETARCARSRLILRRNFPTVFAYEDAQADPQRTLQAILKHARINQPPHLSALKHAHHLAGHLRTKIAPESLSRSILNFGVVNQTFAKYPCLQRMLLDPYHTVFPPCTEPDLPPKAPTKQTTTVPCFGDGSNTGSGLLDECRRAKDRAQDLGLMSSSTSNSEFGICLVY